MLPSFLFKYLTLCRPSLSTTSFFFKVPRVRLFHGLSLLPLSHPLVVLGPTSLSLQPPRLSRRLSHSLYRVPATPCRSTLLYDSRYFTLLPSSNGLPLPSSKEGNESETVRHCRLSALAIPLFLQLFSFVSLSLSFPPCCVSLSHPLTLYRSIPLSLCLSSSFRLFLTLSLYLSLAPFRYTRQPYFPLWLTRSRLLSFLPPRGCHPPSTLLIFPPLSLKLKSIVAPRARGLCRKHCYPYQLLPTQAPKGIFLRRQLISIDISSIEKISIFTSTKARLGRARAQQCCKH